MPIGLIEISPKNRCHLRNVAIFVVYVTLFLEFLAVFATGLHILEFYRNGVIHEFSESGAFLHYFPLTSIFLDVISIFILNFVLDVLISQDCPKIEIELESISTFTILLIISFVCNFLALVCSFQFGVGFETIFLQILLKHFANYEKEPESREFVDLIHTRYSCCGAFSIEDFLDLSEVDSSLPPMQAIKCSSWEYCSVPLSCCSSASCSQRSEVFESPVNLTSIVDEWFQANGCLSATDNLHFYSHKILPNIFLGSSLIFNFFALIATKYFLTSSFTAKDAELSPDDPSFGWLLDLGYPGPTEVINALKEDPSVKQDNVPHLTSEVSIGSSDTFLSSSGETSREKKIEMNFLPKQLISDSAGKLADLEQKIANISPDSNENEKEGGASNSGEETKNKNHKGKASKNKKKPMAKPKPAAKKKVGPKKNTKAKIGKRKGVKKAGKGKPKTKQTKAPKKSTAKPKGKKKK